jgi:hypothetical protein
MGVGRVILITRTSTGKSKASLRYAFVFQLGKR